MTFRLTDTQEVSLTFSGKTGADNPAPLENVKVESSDESIVTVVDKGEGNFVVQATGKLGTAQLNAEADGRIGDGEKIIFGTETIEVIPGDAVKVSLSFGEPTEKEAVPPA